jgi:hypothetical protein
MKEISAYQASDGRLYKTKKEALAADRAIAVEKLVSSSECFSGGWSKDDIDSIVDFITGSAEELMEILK